MPFVAVAHHHAFAARVQRERIAPIQGVRRFFRHDPGKQVVPRAFPDARVLRQRFHPVPVPGMGAPNLAQWIRA